MNPDFENEIAKKLDEIKEIVKKYGKSVFGDFDVDVIYIHDKTDEFEFYIETNHGGYFRITKYKKK